jgi:hypothetical protein
VLKVLFTAICAFAVVWGAMPVYAQPVPKAKPPAVGPRLDGPQIDPGPKLEPAPKAELAPGKWQPAALWKRKTPAKSAKSKAPEVPVAKATTNNLADEGDVEPPASAESNAPQTIVGPPGGAKPVPTDPKLVASTDLGDSDYWIASSRGCDPSKVPVDAFRCLSFFHRIGDKDLVRQPGEAFMASIRPDRPICFVVHGSYNRWGDVVEESRKIHRWLKNTSPTSPLQVVFFTWPADGNMPYLLPVDIAVLGRRSAAHSIFLAKLITQLPQEQQVSIVGHSHGSRATVATLHLLAGGKLEEGQVLPAGCTCPPHLRAVLIAAAIDHNWLNPGQRYDRALKVPDRVLLIRNSKDGWLTAYQARKVWGERAMGKDGLSRADRAALGPAGKKLVELDAAQFAGYSHSFEEFHHRAELGAALRPYVYFQEDQPAGTAVITPVPVRSAELDDELPPKLPDE